jgi:hypothetical protein
MVNFSIKGAAINLKLKGIIANENKLKIEYDGIYLYVSIMVLGITKNIPCMKYKNATKDF